MRCPNCGSEVDEKWQFCPKCGAKIRKRRGIFDIFSGDLFSRINKQMKEMEKGFSDTERSFEALDISPMFKKPKKGRGFTIKIERHGGKKPKVSVNTFGNVNKEKIKEQLRKQMKAKGPVKISLTPKKPEFKPPKPEKPKSLPSQKPKPSPKKAKPMPKKTQEPKTNVRRVDSKVIVDMEIPGVKDEDDVQINELEESVEVRAMAGNKAYFKILTKPSEFGLSKKSLKDGKLHLEFD